MQRRHQNLWDPQPDRLITAGDNATLYDFGCLLRSEERLCLGKREYKYPTFPTSDIQTVWVSVGVNWKEPLSLSRF